LEKRRPLLYDASDNYVLIVIKSSAFLMIHIFTLARKQSFMYSIMKHSIILNCALLLLFCHAVNADVMFRFTFNGGEAPTASIGCSADDIRLIDSLFSRSSRLRTRRLTSLLPSDHGDHHRQLGANCRDNVPVRLPVHVVPLGALVTAVA
jgi:hypothetical protein